MPYTLRQPNNPNTDVVVLGVIKNLLAVDPVTGQPNTQLGINQANLGKDLIYIQNKYQMSQGAFPAVHLSSGTQRYAKDSRSTWLGLVNVIVEYYDRWDKRPDTIETIRAQIAADLERMKANLEDNNSLAWQGSAYAISLSTIELSPYKGSIDEQFPGLVLIRRSMTVPVNLLPYDAF